MQHFGMIVSLENLFFLSTSCYAMLCYPILSYPIAPSGDLPVKISNEEIRPSGHLVFFSGCLPEFPSSSLSTSHVGVFKAEAVGWFTAHGSEEGSVGIPCFDAAQDALL